MTGKNPPIYFSKKEDGKWRIYSRVWNTGMFGHYQWFTNYVAEADTKAEAEKILNRLNSGIKT